MKESFAEKEINTDILEVREEVTELTLEYPNAMTVCPICGSKDHADQVEMFHKHDHSSDAEKSVKELGKVIKDLTGKYPEAMNYCPICGSKL